MTRKTNIIPLAILLIAASGCASLQDHFVDVEMGLRNRVLSQQGWNEWSWCYDDLDHPYHFAKGFKDGYKNILEGGNGCQPTLPPRCYWKPHFQTPEGRCKINAWFDGYSHGALAAQQDGFGNLNEIPLSPTARSNMISREAPVSAGIYHEMLGTSPVPDTLPSENESGSVTIGDPSVTLPPGEAGTELAVPVRPYDD